MENSWANRTLWNIYGKYMTNIWNLRIYLRYISKYLATSYGNYLILSLFRGFQGLIVVHPSLGTDMRIDMAMQRWGAMR